MKAIFLCESKKQIERVYAEGVTARLGGLFDMGAEVVSRADITAEPERFRDVEVVFSTWGMPTLAEEELEAALPRLRAVFYAAGTVQSFARPFLARGVRVFSAWAANAVPVAEYTVAQIVLANKGFYGHTRQMRAQRLAEGKRRKGIYPGTYGVSVGLIGCGMIGSMVAERLKGYKVNVLVYDPFLSEERARALSVTRVTLEELFSRCFVVSNHLANNAETKGMLTGELFSRMPEYATFLNTGRGAQVVEEDLVRVLTERPDLTAVLDVTYPEPPVADHPFYTLENCFLTPHVAGSLGDEVVRMAEYMADEAEAWLKGTPTRYEVTPEMLKTMA